MDKMDKHGRNGQIWTNMDEMDNCICELHKSTKLRARVRARARVRKNKEFGTVIDFRSFILK